MTETTAVAPTRSEPGAIDPERAAAFAERLAGVLNDGALTLMLSIGHRVGLFDTMAGLPPSTSATIAAAAQLDERYVREWLGAVTTSGIVDYDSAARTYRLPVEHAASLTRAAGPGNLAIQAQYIPLLASVETLVVECFRTGGGVPYSEYSEFQRLMAEDSAAVHDAALLDSTLPLVDGLLDRLRAGIDVADIGCGSGHAINLMAEAFPASRFVGFDFSAEGIAAASREAQNLGLTNTRFEVCDVTDLGLTDAFDLITAFDAIHDQAHPAAVLETIAQALRPDGTFLMVDIRASSDVAENADHPLGPFLYAVSTMHCMTVSLALNGDGLGTMWGEQVARSMLADAGFTRVEVAHIDEDILNAYYLATKT
jgi:SAM-dependent methyltransferase